MGKSSKRLMCLSPLVLVLSLMSFRAADPTASTQKRFYTDYATHEEELVDAKKLNLDLQEESSVLMKNENNVLPFNNRVKNVTVFGQASYNYRSGGGGSGSSGTDSDATVLNALEGAGLKVNPKVMYLNSTWTNSSVEYPTSYLAPAEGSYSLYHDAAVVVISRPGSEFSDNKAYNCDGHANKLDHILMLQDNEKELLKYVREQGFDKVVVVINSAGAMELDPIINGELKSYVDSVLWIGYTGQNGILALGELLTGERSPSGRTVDIYPKDQKKDPTWNNFADGKHVGATVDAEGKVTTTDKTTVLGPDGKKYTGWGTGSSYVSVEYEEGIYVGYRYYETRGDVEKAKDASSTWYEENVTFPFGYGLSYTSFSYEVEAPTLTKITSIDQEISLKVKVTNTGDLPGKDVVQMYYQSDYTTGGIEKATANMSDFAKTKLLDPGDSDTLTLSMKARDMADFDYNDANGNGFKGYELEAGNYKVSLQKNSHDMIAGGEFTYTIDQASNDTATKGKTGLKVEKSAKTNKDIKPQFSDTDFTGTNKVGVAESDKTAKKGLTYMSRADFEGTFPTAPTAADLSYSQAALDFLDGQYADYCYEDKETDPWYKTKKDVEGWTQLSDADAKAKPKASDRGVDLNTMIGKDIDDKGWDAILNKLSWEEMKAYLNGNSRHMAALDGVGKLYEVDDDGPAQLKNSVKGKKGVSWVSEVNIASTYNKDLAYEQGIMVGNDALFVGVTGWYGPAADIHRSALSGRNFEYYSQDGVQGGIIAAQVIKGAQSKGIHTYFKHFFLNDQETGRGTSGGLITYCNEQALRQVYLKAFELAFTEADCNGTMSAFNRVGLNKSVNYNLYHNILQDEWGMKGVSDSDIGGNVQTGYDFIRCNTYPMGNNTRAGSEFEGKWDAAKNMVMVAKDKDEYDAIKADKTGATMGTLESPTQWYWLRDTVKRSLWTYCNTSGIQNGIKVNDIVGDDTLTATVSEKFTKQLGATTEQLNGAQEVRYELESGKLPAGVTIARDGTLSGTPTVSGTYDFTIKMTADGWVTKSMDYKLTVASAFTLSKNTGKVGQAFTGAIATDIIQGLNNTKYTIVDGALPDGLTLAEDGNITGTPTKAGTFTFTMNYYGESGSGRRLTRSNYQETYTITIEGDGSDSGEKKDEAAEAKKAAEAAQKAADEAKAKADELEKKIAEMNSSKSGGCGGSVIAATSAIGAVALVGAAIVLKKKKEDK